nr:MAG TPA: hypothetical protein [Caudoviricetes sp.]
MKKYPAQNEKSCPWESGGIDIPITHERSGQNARI